MEVNLVTVFNLKKPGLRLANNIVGILINNGVICNMIGFIKKE